mmetsp:Transcript_13501/g.37959  ORF Transcript_13501/g.37959 Transcript_13501/m.37959 type:complete len:211 (+) Transcript_13501:391-1023(+)
MPRNPDQVTVRVVFAPLPEEERDVERSAAKEFALRTAQHFTGTTTTDDGNRCATELVHLADWDKETFMESMAKRASPEIDDNDATATTTVVVFLVSCGPDGSVHRQVRKITKWFREQQQQTTSGSSATIAIVALLGHAVCKTSAEQMADEVFSSGRRLAKSIRGLVPESSTITPRFVLETQVELEPPEEKFDPWVKSWVNRLQNQWTNQS